MIHSIIHAAIGVLFLIGFSYLLVKLQDHAEKKSKRKRHKKFEFIDRYYHNLENESENREN